ncbi:MAG: hypothetical protein RIE53_06460 [Rhodothermales bacterium]
MSIVRPFPAALLLGAAALLLSVTGCGRGTPATDGPMVDNPFHGPHQSDGRYRLEVEELARFGADEAPDEEVLTSASGVQFDDAGNIYFMDRTRLVSFGPDGSLRWETGREGEGPGEFNRAFGVIMTAQGALMISNQAGQRFDFYDLGGNLLSSVSRDALGLPGFPRPVAFLPDSTVLFNSSVPGMMGARVMRVDAANNWAMVDSFSVDLSDGGEVLAGMALGGNVGFVNDHVAIGHPSRYEFVLHTLEGDTVRVVRRDVADFTRPGFATFGSGGMGARVYSILSLPVPLEGGFQLVRASWPTNIDDPNEHTRQSFAQENPPDPIIHHTFDVYDENWQLLFSVENEEAEALDISSLGSAAVVAPGEFYITRSSPYPHVAHVRIRVIDTRGR